MFTLLMLLIAGAALDDAARGDWTGNKPRRNNKYSRGNRRRYKKDNSWLDAAWFHDHNKNI